MRDLQTLDRQLLNTEFEMARALYIHGRDQGISPYKLAALIYRHGYLDGKDTMKQTVKDVHRRYHQKAIGALPDTNEESEDSNNG